MSNQRPLRHDVLVRPASWAAVAGSGAVGVSAVAASTALCSAGAVLTTAAGVVLVLGFSGITGLVMTAVAGARDPRALLVAALVSYVAKLIVFGIAAALGSGVAGFVPLAFALGASATLLTWLVVEAVTVLGSPRLRLETFGGPVDQPAASTSPEPGVHVPS